jgi:hypothetical protein
LQYNKNGGFGAVPIAIYDDINNKLNIGGVTVTSTGRIGVNSSSPVSRFDIVTTDSQSIYIRSTYGSGNIVRIDKSVSDTTPFVINASGSVGINVAAPISPLDVVGNVSITGEMRLYNGSRTFYAGLQPPTLTSNVSLTLPSSVGVANSILYTTGSGVLDWISSSALVASGLTSTNGLVEGNANLYFTDERAQDAVGSAINAGIKTGIEVTYDDANNAINFNVPTTTLSPFTTKGFSMPL